MERTTISRNQLINQIILIGHGDLTVYTCLPAVQEEPDLFAHLIAWNHIKGEIRDSKIAFPILALRGTPDQELYANAVAHMLLLDPKNLVKSVDFHRSLTKQGYPVLGGAGNMLQDGINKYLAIREESPKWWNSVALHHRKSLKTLYCRIHKRPSSYAQAVLFDRKYPKGSVFEAISMLKNMGAQEAAGTILNHKIPFLIAVGALGGIKGKTDILLALIEGMSGNEFIGNTEMLRKMGVFDNPVLKAAYAEAAERTKKDKRVSTLKAGKATEKIQDAKVKEKMKGVLNEKLEQLGGIEGDWLIEGDISGSMQRSITLSKQIAALIAQQVKGRVYLIFCNHNPYRYEVTGKSLTEINDMTKRVVAGGATALGCGLELLSDRNELVQGIGICSDGGDGGGGARPLFSEAYLRYATKMGIEPTVYHYWVPGDPNVLGPLCERAGIPIQTIDASKVDYYALPNLIKTMRTSRFTLFDEIMNTPLLTIKQAIERRE